MEFDWRLFLCAVGLALIFEGTPHFLFAERMPNFFRMMAEMPPKIIRKLGFTAILFGLGILFFCLRS